MKRIPQLLLTLLVAGLVGCEATTMYAGKSPVPIILGPVSCLGCQPKAPLPGPIHVRAEAGYTFMTAGGGSMTTWSKEWVRPELAQKAFAAAGKTCRGELRVGRLAATSFGIAGLFLWMYKAHVAVEATAVGWPQKACESIEDKDEDEADAKPDAAEER